MTALLISVLGASLAGSAHCAAMCGAFACAASGTGTSPRERRWSAVAYHGGRLASYATVGVIAGGLGEWVDTSVAWSTFGRPAALLTGVTLVMWGAARLFAFAGIRLPAVGPTGDFTVVRGLLRRASARPPAERAALLGLLTPLLPCGWLYAFVAPAIASGSTLGGAAVMAVFWVGSIPALVAIAVGAQRLAGPGRRYLPLVAAAALIVVGSVTIARAVREAQPPAHFHAAVR